MLVEGLVSVVSDVIIKGVGDVIVAVLVRG